MPWREGRACHAPSASPKLPLTQETTSDAPHVLLLPRPSPVLCIFWDMTASSSHVVACARVRCYQGMVTLLPTVNGGAVMVVWWFCFQGGTTVLPARCQCVIQCVAREGCNAAYRSRRATGGRRCCKDLAEDLLKWCDDTIVFFFATIVFSFFYLCIEIVLRCPGRVLHRCLWWGRVCYNIIFFLLRDLQWGPNGLGIFVSFVGKPSFATLKQKFSLHSARGPGPGARKLNFGGLPNIVLKINY
jgi:hypothetical protein